MKVTLVSDSTFLIEHQGIRLLTDPWIGTLIYGGAWLQYPPPRIAARDVGRLDYLFISHIHEDHCDPATIAELDRDATVILLDRKPNFVASFLKKHGFHFKRVLNLKAFTRTELAPDFSVELLDADPAHELNHLIDSSLLVHWRDQTLYFGNDNPPYPQLLPHLKKYRYALALLPASGGSGYPACFTNLSFQQREQEKLRIQVQYQKIFVDAIESLRPKRFMPIAGSHVLAGANVGMNSQMTFLDTPMQAFRFAAEHLSAEAHASCLPLLLRPGESWDESSSPSASETWRSAIEGEDEWRADKARFVKEVAARTRYDHDDFRFPTATDWPALFRQAARNLTESFARSGLRSAGHLYIELPNALGHASLGSLTSEVLPADAARIEPYLAIECPWPLLYQLLTGDFSWNIADAACYLKYNRVPNLYDPSMVIALNYLRVSAEQRP